GAKRPWTRISRNTRALPTWTPRCRSRTRTLRVPSLGNGLVARIARIRATTSRSLWTVFGPRFVAIVAGAAVRAYTDERGTRHTSHTVRSGYRFPTIGLRRRLISAASARPPRTPFFRAGVPPGRGASSFCRVCAAPAVRRHLDLPPPPVERLPADQPEDDLHLPLRTPPFGEVIRSLRRHRRLCHWSAPSCPVSRETGTAPIGAKFGSATIPSWPSVSSACATHSLSVDASSTTRARPRPSRSAANRSPLVRTRRSRSTCRPSPPMHTWLSR